MKATMGDMQHLNRLVKLRRYCWSLLPCIWAM